jgi:hypothetical protein
MINIFISIWLSEMKHYVVLIAIVYQKGIFNCTLFLRPAEHENNILIARNNKTRNARISNICCWYFKDVLR